MQKMAKLFTLSVEFAQNIPTYFND